MGGFNYIISKRFLILMLVLPVCQISAQTDYLSLPVSLKTDSITIEQSLGQLTKQCKCYFTYDANLIIETQKTSLNILNQPLSIVLDYLFNDSSINYLVVGNQIVIHSLKFPQKAIDSLPKIDSFRVIHGKVLDKSTMKPLPFATVAIKSKSAGAITNENGEYALKLSTVSNYDTLCISFVGYLLAEYPVNQYPGDGIIKLAPSFVSLQEVVVRSNSPDAILRKALVNIEKNYYCKEYNYKAFYRESVKKNKQVKTYSEAVLNGFKPKLSSSLDMDRVELAKGRKFLNISHFDTVSVRLKGGIETCFQLDLIHQPSDFVTTEGFLLYNYHLNDITLYENSLVYVIGFDPKPGSEGLFEGEIFIDFTSFAIVRVEFKFLPQKLSKAQGLFIMHKSRQIRITPIDTRYFVNYTQINGKYFASHIFGELMFKVKKRRQFLNEKYTTTLEMAFTGMDTIDVQKPTIRNLFKTNTILAEDQSIYDEKFWGDQNVILPEEDIKKAIFKAGFKMEVEGE